MVATINLLAVDKQPHIKNGYMLFLSQPVIIRSMKLEKSSVVLRMS